MLPSERAMTLASLKMEMEALDYAIKVLEDYTKARQEPYFKTDEENSPNAKAISNADRS